MNNNYLIRRETNDDYFCVENLTREAFWNVYRPKCLEHYVLHTFRQKDDFIKELDLVLVLDGEIIAHVMYSKSKILTDDGRELPIATFGPFSVLPSKQKTGYGKALLSYSLERAKSLGIGAIAIEGDYDYYKKFGFVKGKDAGIFYAEDKSADYFLVKELNEGFLSGITGIYRDPEGYFVDENEALEFDGLFPEKKS